MVLHNSLVFPSLEEWDYRYELRGLTQRLQSRAYDHFSIGRVERSVVGWRIQPSTHYPITQRRRLFFNILHLFLFPFYLFWKIFEFLFEDFHGHVRHSIVFPGAFLLLREIAGLPVRRRYLNAFHKKGHHVAATVHKFTSPSSSRRHLLLEFSLPGDAIQFAVQVGNVRSLYNRETKLRPGDSVDLVVMPKSTDHELYCNFFTSETLAEETFKSAFVLRKSMLCVFIGACGIILGTIVYVCLVLYPLVWFFFYLLKQDQLSAITSSCFRDKPSTCMPVLWLFFYLAAVVQAFNTYSILNKLCFYFNCAEYHAEEKGNVERGL